MHDKNYKRIVTVWKHALGAKNIETYLFVISSVVNCDIGHVHRAVPEAGVLCLGKQVVSTGSFPTQDKVTQDQVRQHVRRM